MASKHPLNVPIVPFEIEGKNYHRILGGIVESFAERGLQREKYKEFIYGSFGHSLFESERGSFFQVPGQFVFSVCLIRSVVFVPLTEVDLQVLVNNYIQRYLV